MTQTKITDRLLTPLAIANLLMIFLLCWTLWLPLSFAWSPHTGNASGWVLNILLHGFALNSAIFLLAAIAFFRKWRYWLLAYIPYSAYMLPQLYHSIQQTLSPNNLQLSLAGTVWTFSLFTLLVLTVITTIIFVIERLTCQQ